MWIKDAVLTSRSDNTAICAEADIPEGTHLINRSVACLSFDVMQRLPKELLDCILALAAVHMASHNPGNRQLETLALEAKVDVFQGFNRILHNPGLQSPDVVVSCAILVFAMHVRHPSAIIDEDN